jgi:uncharacterized protein (TIGR02594 family)
MMQIGIIIALIFSGVGAFILIDLYKAGVRTFSQFDRRRYWQTNQVRILMLLLGALVITLIIYMLKSYIDDVVAQAIAIASGMASGAASKGISKDSRVSKRPSLLEVARPEIGQKEVPGTQHNPRILKYGKDTGLSVTNDEDGWCSVFANWVAWRTGRTGTGSKMAKSWLSWGVEATEADIPSGNVIAVFHRGKPGAATGHVGIVDSFSGSTFQILGGNQSDSVSVAPFKKDERFLALRKPE